MENKIFKNIKIADDLITDDNNIVLSAKQGKVLNEIKAPAYSYGIEDLIVGESVLTTGQLYFVYE